MSQQVFLRMCNSRQDVIYDHFVLVVKSIRSLLDGLNADVPAAAEPLTRPSVSPYFFEQFKVYLCEKFVTIMEDDDLFHRAELLMDCTLSYTRFADYSPSMNALASFLVATQECCIHDETNTDLATSTAEEVLTELITHCHHNGGYNDLPCLGRIVAELRYYYWIVERERVEEQIRRGGSQGEDEDIMHVIHEW